MSDLDKRLQKKDVGFSIIHHFGSPNEAYTLDNLKVERQEYLYAGITYGMVRCAPYDDHFIYNDPYKVRPGIDAPRWLAMCTCGSPAVIVGTKVYGIYASPEGYLLVCMAHMTNGVHQTGGRKWI